MLSLTHIFLYNWHRFRCQLIDVQDSLYFIGNNGAGKSTILDAMQVILLADLTMIRFNSSTQDKSARTLDGFVRGKLSETRWLRPGDTIGYIALEFADEKSGYTVTLGCCIEASPSLGSNGVRSYFILKELLDASFLIPHGSALDRLALKKTLQRQPKARYYDHVKEYQEDMLDALGGLNRRFFDLFQRALSFKPITKIDEFVQHWLLSPQPLDVQNLQQVVERLESLSASAETVNKKLHLLEQISESRKNYLRQRELQAQYEVLYALLNGEMALRAKQDLVQQLDVVTDQLRADEQHLQQINTTLKEAKEKENATKQRLYGLDVMRERESLHSAITSKTSEVNSIVAHRLDVIQRLQATADALHKVEDAPFLDIVEQQAIHAFISSMSSLQSDKPIYATIADITRQTIAVLAQLLERIQERIFTIKNQLNVQNERINSLTTTIERLKQGASISYSPSVLTLRDALDSLIGSRPKVLCELVEVPDERWQKAVEAMLGNRRFNLIVPPNTYEDVLDYIERVKTDTRFHDARVLDLERASKEARRALPNSLALQVETEDPSLRAYLDSILGAIITCLSAREIRQRQYHRAITPDLIYYSEWAIQVLPYQQYERWFVGKRATHSHVASYERERQQLRETNIALTTQHQRAVTERKQLDYKDTLSFLLLALDNPSDERPLLLQIAQLQEKLDALDMSEAERLDAEVKRLGQFILDEEKVWREVVKEQAAHTSNKDNLNQKINEATIIVVERVQASTECISKNPTTEPVARTIFETQKQESDLSQVILNAQKSAKSFTTRANEALSELSKQRQAYNITYQFVGLTDVIDDTRYAREQERLSATQLPMYTAQIEQARQEADQELREHVLHKLRESIQQAKNELKRMNDALRSLTFHGDRYQFHWEVASQVREYYRLIDESQFIGHDTLFGSNFYEQNKDAFEQFYHQLIQPAQTDTEKKAREALTDYRTYLKYDIEVRHSDGNTSMLSNIVGETSGGETQTPFYLAIAASFVQLYRMMDQKSARHTRPTICLIVFDEAFNRMDQERISVTLDMFQQFKLQTVTATPLERSEYLVPQMCTNLVVTRVREQVFIENYRNYAARLREKYAE